MAKSDKKAFWQNHVDTWRSSGLTQTAYAQQNGLRLKQFHYYKRALSKKPTKPVPSILPVSVFDDSPSDTTSMPSGITLTAPGGFQIELQPGFNASLLKQVLRVLEGV